MNKSLKFITIDDLIISADLSDLQVLRYPGPSLISFPEHRNDSPGQFVLKVNRLDYLDKAHLIPDGPPHSFDIWRPVIHHGSFARSFDMAVYEGSPNDRGTWKELSKFGGCLFDIAADRDEWIRFQEEQVKPLLSEREPEIYLLSGRFREYWSATVCWDGLDIKSVQAA